MGFFNKEKARERKAFRKIVEKRTTQSARTAFSDESVKVAAERARAKARRKSIGELVADKFRGSVERKIEGRKTPTTRRAPVRRRAVKRAAPVRRASRRRTVRRTARPLRKVVRRLAPAKRRVVKRTVRQPAPKEERQPATLNDAIYGGY